MKTTVMLAAVVLSLGLTACDDTPDGNGTPTPDAGVTPDAGTEPGTIAEVASGNADFSILVEAATKAGLVDALSDDSAELTVFAPTNAAFEALFSELGVSGVDALTAEQLRPILRYHVMSSEVRAEAATAAAQANQKIDTLGGKVQLSYPGGAIRLDDRAQVTAADVDASNGVIHVIDAVLLPSIADIATTDERFSSLAAALVAADGASPSPNLVATLDDDAAADGFTVFAPVNDAFTELVTTLAGSDDGATTGISELSDFRADQLLPVLTYHVLPGRVMAADVPASGNVDALGGSLAVARSGSDVTVDGVQVVEADVLASNGVIHGIGSVLVPSITDVVTTSPALSSLKDAVIAADSDGSTSPKVAEALNGAGPFTLFAPNNAAFSSLGAAPSGQALTNVLLYHAVPGDPVYAATALGFTDPVDVDTALAGHTLEVQAVADPAGVQLTDGTGATAQVTVTNLFTSNGVIHVVDKVLLPAP